MLGKVGEAQFAMLSMGEEMLGWIREKMATQESTLGSGKFFAFYLTIARNSASAYSGLCIPG